MELPRFYIPEYSPTESEFLSLPQAESHHCKNVLRCQVQDQVSVFNGKGQEWQGIITSLNDKKVTLQISTTKTTPLPQTQISLAQCIPKGKNMEHIIQKATELGCWKILPLFSTRTIKQIKERDREKKREKWQRIAIEACKQCGQNWLPQIALPQKMENFFQTGASYYDLLFIGSLAKGAQHLKHHLADLPLTAKKSSPLKIVICIGPEGDFTPSELTLATEYGFKALDFGSIVLRTETAALYSLSILHHEFQEMTLY